jgi:Ulp1 protease family, C-terminal catalytic domain
MRRVQSVGHRIRNGRQLYDDTQDVTATPVARSTRAGVPRQKIQAPRQSEIASNSDSSPDPLLKDSRQSPLLDGDSAHGRKLDLPLRPLWKHFRHSRAKDRVDVDLRSQEQKAALVGQQTPQPIARRPKAEERLGTSERRHITRRGKRKDELEESFANLQLERDLDAFVAAAEERLAKERAETERKRRLEEEELERRAGRKAPSEPIIAPLSSEWKTKLAQVMEHPYGRQLATAPDGTEITRKDFGTLYPQRGSHDNPSGWLNDEIINTYMRHIVEFAHARIGHKRNDTPKFHNFVSQFYQNLSSKGPQSVARWAKRAKIPGEKLNEVEMVFIPCNPGVHWTMLVVHPKRKLVEYFDSFHGNAVEFLNVAEAWLRMELPGFNREEWTFREGIGPTQQNSSDCGVFAITTAKMVMLGIDPEKAYTEKDLPLQRKRIACELMNGGFTGDFAPPERDIYNESLHVSKALSRPATSGGEARL